MKWIIVKEKRIITLTCSFFLFAAIVIVMVHSGIAETVSSETRHSPIRCVQTEEKKAAITFDADTDDLETQRLIEVLRRYNIRSTFFIVGAWADKYPESLKMLVAAGHEIGNHSSTHPHMRELSRNDIRKQIIECNKKIQTISGVEPTLFRPPYGDSDSTVTEAAQSLSMTCVLWNVDSMDWANLPPRKIAERVLTQVKPGSIILFHCGARNTAAALPEIIDTLLARGYELVPVSSLL